MLNASCLRFIALLAFICSSVQVRDGWERAVQLAGPPTALRVLCIAHLVIAAVLAGLRLAAWRSARHLAPRGRHGLFPFRVLGHKDGVQLSQLSRQQPDRLQQRLQWLQWLRRPRPGRAPGGLPVHGMRVGAVLE